MKIVLRIIMVALVAGGVWAAIKVLWPAPKETVQARLVSQPETLDGFERATGPRPLTFPEDFGPHPGFQTEWWYYTGNLKTPEGRHFGYQLTFFRRSIAPVTDVPERESAWAAGQVYLAHFALTDVSAKRFHSFEKTERGAAGLAGAQGTPLFRAWLEDWRVEQTGERTYRLQAAEGELSLDLSKEDSKGPVLEGDRGYSQKGPDPGNASIYFSQTRLVTTGTIRIGNERFDVAGSSWMDHEFSTSALSPGQVGWDWFALQLSGGSELMVFTIRREDGSVDPFSGGTWIGPDGSTRRLDSDDFTMEVLDTWRSGYSKAEYPAKWRIQAPGLNLDLLVEPYLADQEHHLSFVYWEGAVKINGSAGGAPVTGDGYVELTGYSGSMAGQF